MSPSQDYVSRAGHKLEGALRPALERVQQAHIGFEVKLIAWARDRLPLYEASDSGAGALSRFFVDMGYEVPDFLRC